jgi:dsDNA-specific endonuclease/ATPase MutS2
MKALSYEQKERIGFTYIMGQLQPSSPYGTERVRELSPVENKTELLRQLDNVRRMLSVPEDGSLRRMLQLFHGLKMLRPTARKGRENDLNEIELFELKRFLLQTAEILPLWKELQEKWQLQGVGLADTEAALDLLDPHGHRVASFYLEDDSSPLLTLLRQEKRSLEAELHRAPCDELYARRSLVAAQEESEEQRLRSELSKKLRPYLGDILQNMEAIGELDLTVEKARLAARFGGVYPEIKEGLLDFSQMRYPKIENFTPISLSLPIGATVITGANMGGKSVALKTLALNVYLIHCGLFPFAQKAVCPLFDALLFLAEDAEDTDKGLSSFGGEILRLREALDTIRKGFCLVLLDEFARGTNPDEGAALVQGLTEYLDGLPVMAVLATHYDKVAQKASAHYQVVGLRNASEEELSARLRNLDGAGSLKLLQQYMNYGLYPVWDAGDCPKDALRICRLLGLEEEILSLVENNYGI